MYKKPYFKNPCCNPCQGNMGCSCHKPCHNPCQKGCHMPDPCQRKCHMPNPCHKPCQPKPCYHKPQNKCVDKYYYHEVPHCCPVHTRYNNHHVYKHKYYPVYTCDKKDYYYNCDKGSCCNF